MNANRQTTVIQANTEERTMKITASNLIPWAGLAAVAAGIIFAQASFDAAFIVAAASPIVGLVLLLTLLRRDATRRSRRGLRFHVR